MFLESSLCLLSSKITTNTFQRLSWVLPVTSDSTQNVFLNLYKHDLCTSNNYQITYRPPLLETNDHANESAHWFGYILCWEIQRFVIKMQLWVHSLPEIADVLQSWWISQIHSKTQSLWLGWNMQLQFTFPICFELFLKMSLLPENSQLELHSMTTYSPIIFLQ